MAPLVLSWSLCHFSVQAVLSILASKIEVFVCFLQFVVGLWKSLLLILSLFRTKLERPSLKGEFLKALRDCLDLETACSAASGLVLSLPWVSWCSSGHVASSFYRSHPRGSQGFLAELVCRAMARTQAPTLGSSNPPSSLLVSLADPGPWPVRTALRQARRVALHRCLTGSHPALPRPAAQSHLPRVGPSHGFINYHALHCVSDGELLCCMDHKILQEYKQRSSAVFQQEKKCPLDLEEL